MLATIYQHPSDHMIILGNARTSYMFYFSYPSQPGGILGSSHLSSKKVPRGILGTTGVALNLCTVKYR